MELKLILLIGHLIGVAVGAGGAYTSDMMFFSSAKDGKISKTELRFLQIGSKMVWIGLLILFISGAGLFALDPAGYMASTKFQAKATIVLIIFLNGLVFHFAHLDRIKRHVGEHFPSSDEFMRKRPILLASGAVSFVSWTSALILGKLSGLPFSYSEIMLSYLGMVAVAVAGSLILFRRAT